MKNKVSGAPGGFTRTTQMCRLRGIRCVSNGALLVLNYSLSNACAPKSRDALHKLNRHTAVKFLAHPARFTRTTQMCRLRGIRCVSNGALLVLNYSLSNACAPKSRDALHKLNRHTAVKFLAHPARFERAVPAFGGRCSIQLSHGCKRHLL